MKLITKLKINTVVTMITIMIMADTDLGIVKLIGWGALFIEMMIYALAFEKELR